jgi:hypothetical protein
LYYPTHKKKAKKENNETGEESDISINMKRFIMKYNGLKVFLTEREANQSTDYLGKLAYDQKLPPGYVKVFKKGEEYLSQTFEDLLESDQKG